MNPRDIKNILYEQVARIGKAVSSPKRLELIEVLCQGEKSVEQLAEAVEITVKLASAHLKELKSARLVESRRNGKNMVYRLADHQTANLWVTLRVLAEERLTELQSALKNFLEQPQALTPASGRKLLEQARRGEVIIIDVRPEEEYAAGHLPHARSMPLPELRKRLRELPADRLIVAYCRGPFCLMAKEATTLLQKKGYRVQRLEDGVAEWRARALPLATA
jgi:rhodanese-related sulfurtransferase